MRYLLHRIGGAALVLSLAFIVAYVMLTALPGDAVMARYGNPDLGLSAAELAEIRTAYGADRPALVQFLDTVLSFLRGDLGFSVQTGAAVSTLLTAALPSTLALASLGLLVAVALAVVISVVATHGGLRHLGATRTLRSALRGLPPLMVSLPVFWIGIVLLQVFSFQLGLVPVLNASPLQSLILPVLTLAIPIAAPLAQVLIRSIDEVSAEPFVAVTRARGASTGWLLTRSVARNATLPALTMAGLLFGELVSGAVVTETVFGRMGVGLVTAQAVAARDTPVLMAVVVLSAVVFVVINLVVDLLYPVLDPRLRRASTAPARRETVAA